MADKILDVRHVMDEMVSPEGLEAGGGGGEVPVIDITASSTNPNVTVDVTKTGTDEAPDFEFEFDGLPDAYKSRNKTIQIVISAISKNMDLTEAHPEFHFTGLKDVYFPGGSGHDSITIKMEKDDGSYPSSGEDGYFTSMTSFCNYFQSLSSLEQARYTWVQVRITHGGYSSYNKIDAAGPFIPSDFYGSTYRPQFNISEIVEDQTAKLTINGTQYDAMQLFSIRWYYIGSAPALDINGQLEIADANITGAINTLIDDTIPVPTYASRTTILSDNTEGAKTVTIAEDGWYRLVVQTGGTEATTQIQTMDGSALCAAGSGTLQGEVIIPIKAGTQLISLCGANCHNYIFKIN